MKKPAVGSATWGDWGRSELAKWAKLPLPCNGSGIGPACSEGRESEGYGVGPSGFLGATVEWTCGASVPCECEVS
jgi:hypothetical protein